jgi:hypothetical protein
MTKSYGQEYDGLDDNIIANYETEQAEPLDVQVGGNHYKGFKIQPVEFIEKNELSFLEGCVIKRICRWKNKNGIEDLEKAKHEIDLMISLYDG